MAKHEWQWWCWIEPLLRLEVFSAQVISESWAKTHKPIFTVNIKNETTLETKILSRIKLFCQNQGLFADAMCSQNEGRITYPFFSEALCNDSDQNG